MPIFDYPKSQIHPKQKHIMNILIDKINAKKVIEIGSWLGESTSCWASSLINKEGSELISVDWFNGNLNTELEGISNSIDIYSLFRSNMKELGYSKIIKNFIMSSSDATKFIPDGYADIVYIDASHDYKSVKEDIDQWLPKVRNGGIISGHDYESNEYDDQCIDLDVFDHKHHGVIKAVNESFDNFNVSERIWWKIIER